MEHDLLYAYRSDIQFWTPIVFGLACAATIFYFRGFSHSYREFRGGIWMEAHRGSRKRIFKDYVPRGWRRSGTVYKTRKYERKRARETMRATTK